jgi:hypothetical protein
MVWLLRGSSYVDVRRRSTSYEGGRGADGSREGSRYRAATTWVMAWPLRGGSHACGRHGSGSYEGGRCAGGKPRGQLLRGGQYQCDGVAIARQQLRMWPP